MRLDYILGRLTTGQIIEAYSISRQALANRIATEKWGEMRAKYAHTDHVKTLYDQIEDLDRRITECAEPKDIDSLYRAKQRALSMLWGITGHPKPPTAKPPKERNLAKERTLKVLAELAEPKKPKKVEPAAE